MQVTKGIIEALIGPGKAFDASEKPEFAVDGIAPAVIAYPESVNELSVLLQFATSEGLAVVPWGAGTHIEMGNPPERLDMIISCQRLGRVLEHQPDDLVVTVEAGISLHALQEYLGPHGQHVPLDPPMAEQATVGGILAANVSGPRRLLYGTARDWVIGTRVVGSGGRISRAGGKVVKSVAGYDLNKLYIGSLGTLAVFAEVTFKLTPLPKALATVILPLPSLQEAMTTALAIHQSPLRPLAVELLDPAAAQALLVPTCRDFFLCIELGGEVEAVERQRHDITQIARGVAHIQALEDAAAQADLWRRLRNFARLGDDKASLIVKSSVQPSRVEELAGGLLSLGRQENQRVAVIAHALVGSVYSYWWSEESDAGLAHVAEKTTPLAAPLGGHTVIERCPLPWKRTVDVWGTPDADFELMRQVKQRFDPAGILNPGRFLGRL